MAESKWSRDSRKNRRRGEHRKHGKRRRDRKQAEQKVRSQQLRVYGNKPMCPYCGRIARKVDNAQKFLGHGSGIVWVCTGYPECDAYVYAHRNSGLPMGTLANRDLRKARKRVHLVLDQLWQTNRLDRTRVYIELAQAMGLSRDACHVGMFDLGQCEEAAAFARFRLRQIYGVK